MEISKKYSESELIYLLQQRGQQVYNYLYDNYSGALLSIIYNIVKDQELSNDVLQDVFVKIWRQIDTYDSAKGRLFTWMLNIARNTAIDTVRSKSYQNSQKNLELTENVHVSIGSSELQTDKIGLKKLVYQLKEDHRILIDLSYFQGFTQDEISKMMNIPLGTVKTRLRTALIQLRTIMQPHK